MHCRRRVAVLAALAVVLAGCGTSTTGPGPDVGATAPPPPGSSAAAVPGTGRVTESRDVRGITGVDLRSIGDLQIRQTGTESLTIEAAPDVLPKLTSEVSGGVLRLGAAPGTGIRTTGPIVYRLSVAVLDSLAVTGAGDVTASGLQAGRLTVDIRGAGDATLAGTVDTQVVTISGTGNYDGEDLQSTAAEVTISGAGDAVVRVGSRLDATIRGAGSVEYIGNPQVTRQVTGVGSVEQR